LPTEVKKIIDDEIIVNEFGITLKSFNRLYKATESWDRQSFIEDNQNHFHVDWYIDPPDNKRAFMLGVYTLILLADKFQQENIKGMRFFLSFQTPELGKQWSKEKNLDKEGDKYNISDRLSFHTRRDGEVVIAIDKNEETFLAILIIDI
jgi:hypothetical protein